MLPWASWLSIKAFRHHFSIRGHGISLLSRKRKRPRLPSKPAREPARESHLDPPQKASHQANFWVNPQKSRLRAVPKSLPFGANSQASPLSRQIPCQKRMAIHQVRHLGKSREAVLKPFRKHAFGDKSPILPSSQSETHSQGKSALSPFNHSVRMKSHRKAYRSSIPRTSCQNLQPGDKPHLGPWFSNRTSDGVRSSSAA